VCTVIRCVAGPVRLGLVNFSTNANRTATDSVRGMPGRNGRWKCKCIHKYKYVIILWGSWTQVPPWSLTVFRPHSCQWVFNNSVGISALVRRDGIVRPLARGWRLPIKPSTLTADLIKFAADLIRLARSSLCCTNDMIWLPHRLHGETIEVDACHVKAIMRVPSDTGGGHVASVDKTPRRRRSAI
jgi:hypothetical protein